MAVTTITQKSVPQANATLQTIYDRRAVRKFKDKAIDRETINHLIDAGRMAPSGMNRQPWRFYVVTDKKLISTMSKEIAKVSVKQIAKISLKEITKSILQYLHSPHDFKFMNASDFIFHGAPLVIFLTAPRENEWAALDIGMCSQNMMLAAKSLGLESCPIGLAKFIEETESISRLGISKSETVLLALIFGYGDETPEVHERKKDNVFFVS
jgi:nitroreductase